MLLLILAKAGPAAAQTAAGALNWLRVNAQVIDHFRDAGGLPSRHLGLLAIRPRSHATLERYCTVGGLYIDVLRIALRTTPDRILDLALHFGSRRERADSDVIDDPFDAAKVCERILGGVTRAMLQSMTVPTLMSH